MTHLDDVLKKDRLAKILPEVETRLLKATHDLASTLRVEPKQVFQALATVVQRRADFERLKGVEKPIRTRSR